MRIHARSVEPLLPSLPKDILSQEHMEKPGVKSLPIPILAYIRDLLLKETIQKSSREYSEKEKWDLFYKKHQRRRRLIRSWPRSPTGKVIHPDSSEQGKEAGNELQLWGATIFDFFFTLRAPGIPGYMTISTSSKLLGWMKIHDETETCADEIAWAEEEESPHIVRVYSIAQLLREQETEIKKGKLGQTLTATDAKKWGLGADVSIFKDSIDTFPESFEKNVKGTIFDPTSALSPWPIEPFSYEPTILNEKLPLHLLPKRLFVHAVGNLLALSEENNRSGPPSIHERETVHTFEYQLKLNTAGQAKLQRELDNETTERERLLLEDEQSPFGFMIPHEWDTPLGPVEPPVFIVHKRPPPPRPAEVAHLYLSTSHHSGTGNHSQVYSAQLDLPRDTLVPEVLCKQCLTDRAEELIAQEDGENGETKDEKWMEESGELTKTWVPAIAKALDIVPQGAPGGTISHSIPWEETESEWKTEYDGPFRYVPVDIDFANPSQGRPYCDHIKNHVSGYGVHPTTARVAVIAKVSKMDDDHLSRESRVYQQFPDHFFEHWSGYNVIPPSHDPVPVSAVVPQFYGYYTPVREEERETLSPIMLVENCGKALDASALSVDDKSECAALMYRMHEEGWLHHSVFDRNFVKQPGPLWEHPSQRGKRGGTSGLDSAHSFRLIDFGRSVEMTDASQRAYEEKVVNDLFGKGF